MNLTSTYLKKIIEEALKEDLPKGDITTDSLSLGSHKVRAHLTAKQDLILSGQALFELTMKHLDPDIHMEWFFQDGQKILNQQTVCTLKGHAEKILKAERVALNFLGWLSGVATKTNHFVNQVGHTKTKILDTRKTIPNYRLLLKKAVKDGGGINHRMNLSDAIMIKDNHIAACNHSLTEAVQKVRAQNQLPIEVEVCSLDLVKEAVGLKVKRIMLDNMNLEQIKEALTLIPEQFETEVSGNMTLDKVRAIAETGVTYISVGAITHSAPSADLSLKFIWN